MVRLPTVGKCPEFQRHAISQSTQRNNGVHLISIQGMTPYKKSAYQYNKT